MLKTCLKNVELLFLSTPSARRATANMIGQIAGAAISIHALREEGDDEIYHVLHDRQYFYPRPPRGGRHQKGVQQWDNIVFLSTPSARRATGIRTSRGNAFNISIHALREEGDPERLTVPFSTNISIHALREEGDRCVRWPAP